MIPRIFRCSSLFILVLLLCFSVLPSASAVEFQDVPKNHWAYTEIAKMTAQGILQGSGGLFHPEELVSKQAFLSMVCRASGLDDRSLESGANWSAPAIAYGQYFGWFNEDEWNEPSAPITREFAAQLLVNAFFPEAVGTSEAIHFQDENDITSSRLPYVQAAVKLGLISGYADGTFLPKSGLTRAAAAALLSRSLLQEELVSGPKIQIPVLMYHDVSYLGHGYSKTPELFKKQMQELKDAGFHTVFFSEIINYVEQGTPLPSKPIVISIDDGYHSNYTYIYPILQELGMKAEISLIGDAIQYADWGMSWDEVREMAKSGLLSFQAHTKSLHSDHTAQGGRLGVLKIASESWSHYVRTLGNDTKAILDLIEKEVGVRPQVFTYPRGKFNAMSEAVTSRLGCKVSLTTKDGIAQVRQGDPSSLRLMGRIGMDFRNGSVVSVLKQFGYQA